MIGDLHSRCVAVQFLNNGLLYGSLRGNPEKYEQCYPGIGINCTLYYFGIYFSILFLSH